MYFFVVIHNEYKNNSVEIGNIIKINLKINRILQKYISICHMTKVGQKVHHLNK